MTVPSIPCFIIARDAFISTRNLAYYLTHCDGVGQITIIDHDSTYPPLLDWYASCPFRVLREPNRGPHGAWAKIGPQDTPYIVTDNDLDLTAVPRDVLRHLVAKLESDAGLLKAGLSLEIEGLPDTPLADLARSYETGFWRERTGDWYHANIDTTFAAYRPGSGWGGYGPSMRSARPYTARHIPWYLDRMNLPDDWKWYFSRSEGQFSTYGAFINTP